MKQVSFRVRDAFGVTVLQTIPITGDRQDEINGARGALMHLKDHGYRVFRVKTHTPGLPDSPATPRQSVADPRD